MMRSLYSAISGLKNHQTYMDVIGNNIANVNTTGFKKSTVTFASALSQSMQGASAPTPAQGGSNPMQVGLGANLGSINQIMTAGSEQTTGNPTDMMIQGSGFFVLNNNGQQVYTRAGGFTQDSAGNLVDPASGAEVQGYSWGTDDTTTPNWGALGAIKFKLGDTLPGEAGFPIDEESPLLDLAAELGTVTPTTDATGDHYADTTLLGAENLTIDGLTRVPDGSSPTTGQFSFDPATGTLTFPAGFDVAGATANIHYISPVAPSAINDLTATVDYPPAPGAVVYNDATGTPVPYTLSTADTPGDGEYSVSNVNGQYQITFGANDKDGNLTSIAGDLGYDFTNKAHTLTSFSIDGNGIITGVYSNGTDSVTHKIAQIAIASFANDSGLQNIGGSFYTTSNNSGVANIGAAGEDGRGGVVSGALEMSNVDLSQEMTDMITAQRGFQANSRVITVSDTLLQELIDLKRQ